MPRLRQRRLLLATRCWHRPSLAFLPSPPPRTHVARYLPPLSSTPRERHRAHRARAAAYLAELQAAEAAEAAAEAAAEVERRTAVAPAVGSAGLGTGVRPPPVSDTYRELATLRINLEE